MTEVSHPAALGYRWPAEWEPHAATWCAWPHNVASWPGKFEPVPQQFAEMVRALARYEPVQVLAGDAAVLADAQAWVGDMPNVMLHEIPTNDAWCRDHGPTFLSSPAGQPPALIDWTYNAWGGKYPPYDLDDAVPSRIAALQGRIRYRPELVLEGGAIEGNGRGTLLTTASCLLNPNRNPDRSRSDVEGILRDFLGARQVLWLPRGELAGDDTDGHIDQLARFVNETTIVAAICRDRHDLNHDPLQENLAFLQGMQDADGHALKVVPLPLPQPLYQNGQRLPASYLNFYIANGVVLVPQFDDPADAEALAVLAPFFPQRQLIGLPALDLVWGLGAFHCLTQQEPR